MGHQPNAPGRERPAVRKTTAQGSPRPEQGQNRPTTPTRSVLAASVGWVTDGPIDRPGQGVPDSGTSGRSGTTVLVASLVARIPQGMAPLAILLLVHGRTGSVATAGLATGAWAIGAAAAPPLWARPAGRGRAERVVVVLGLAQALVLAIIASWPGDQVVAWLGLAALGGLLAPPVTPVARTLWPRLGRSAHDVDRLYTLDATAQELIFIVGPALVGALVAGYSPSAALFAAAAAGAVGAALFGRVIAPIWEPHPSTVDRPPLGRGLWVPWLSLFALSLGLGTTEVGVPATALADGRAAASGLILAVWSLGSLVGGVISSRRVWGATPARRAPALLGGLIAGSILVWIAWGYGLGWLTAALFVAGLALAPTLAALYGVIADVSNETRRTDAFAFGNTSILLGLGLGAAVGGKLSALDPRLGFAASAGLFALAAAPTLLQRVRSTRRSSHTGSSAS